MRRRIAGMLIRLAHKVYPPRVTEFHVGRPGLDHMAPGAGSAAQVGIDIANRAIRNARYAGQHAGMGFAAAMETLDQPLDMPPWQKHLLGGLVGDRPALSNKAKLKRSLWQRLIAWVRGR